MNNDTIKAADEYASKYNFPIHEQIALKAFKEGSKYTQAQKDEHIKELVEALSNLVISQNGPPLEREKEYWQKSYDKANELIQKYKQAR